MYTINILEEKIVYPSKTNLNFKRTKKQYIISIENLTGFDIWDAIAKWTIKKSSDFKKDYDIEINMPSISDFNISNEEYYDNTDFLSSFFFSVSSGHSLLKEEKSYTVYKYKFYLE